MKTLVKLLILFLVITGVATILINSFHVNFGTTDFWRVHGFLFLVFITIFPRLTLLFSSVSFGGVFWWLGWLFAPRFLVAILATLAYWQTNEVLVLAAWVVALGGESGEKYVMHEKVVLRHKSHRSRDVR